MSNEDIRKLEYSYFYAALIIFVPLFMLKYLLPSPYTQRELTILLLFFSFGAVSFMFLICTIMLRGWMPEDK